MSFFKNRFIKRLASSCLDLAPVLTVVIIFQVFVVKQPIPHLDNLLIGTVFVVLGLTIFVQGLELSLFPIGEAMAYAFARKGSVIWLLIFAFCLGFGSVAAEPSLIAVTNEIANVASKAKLITETAVAKANYALGLRLTIALSVGFAILIGVLRIIRGWPVYYPMLCGYVAVLLITPFTPPEIIGIAYGSGGVATTTITVPLVTALGIGLATAIRGRNPMIDGFGLIAFATLMPTVFVMIYGILQ
jgi:MFS family permease